MAKNQNWLKIIGAGIVFGILAQIFHTIEAFLTMDFYFMEELIPVWSKIMMPTAGPPPTSFYIYGVVFAVITGILFAYVYSVVKASVPGKGINKGIYYGLLVFLIAGLPGTLSMYILINLPAMLLVYWAIFLLIIDLVGGVAVSKIVT